MRRLATSVAAVSFFVLAGVGWAHDLPVEDCALKGAVGAGVMFVVVLVAGRAAVSVLVSSVAARRAGREGERER